jgi:hypothetical protein
VLHLEPGLRHLHAQVLGLVRCGRCRRRRCWRARPRACRSAPAGTRVRS